MLLSQGLVLAPGLSGGEPMRNTEHIGTGFRSAVCLVLLFVMLDSTHAQASFEHRFQAFRAEAGDVLDRKAQPRALLVRRAFDRQFSDVQDMSSLSPEDAGHYLRAIADAAFHQPDPTLTATAMQLVLQHRVTGLSIASGPTLVEQMLLADRNFAAARTWRVRFPQSGREPLPQVARLQVPQHNVYLVGAEGRFLLEAHSGAKERDGLIVVGHPACSFSRDAMKWMRDNALATSEHAPVWLSPVDGNLQLALLARWNRQYPTQAFVIARFATDWDFITTWDTPQFYWMQGGQVREHSTGWNEQSRALLVRYQEHVSHG